MEAHAAVGYLLVAAEPNARPQSSLNVQNLTYLYVYLCWLCISLLKEREQINQALLNQDRECELVKGLF